MRTQFDSLVSTTAIAVIAALAAVAAPPVLAAPSSASILYQGVLRNLSNQPLTGTYDMTLRLWSLSSGGDEILIDRHLGGGGVAVANGLFAVEVGGGALSDGAGPGAYIAPADVFRDYDVVYLEVTVGADTLTPRTRIVTAAAALNSAALAGHPSTYFLDTSSSAQTKTGRVTIDDASSTPGYGLMVQSAGVAAVQGSSKIASGVGYLGYSDVGAWGAGNYAGGFFQSHNATGSVLTGYGNVGIQGDGRSSGAIFTQSDSNGLALLAQNGVGGNFYGTGVGAAFTSVHDYGIQARGTFPSAAARFTDATHSGLASIAIGHTGIVAQGSQQGAEFYDTDSPGFAWVGIGGTAVYGRGSYSADTSYGAGGYFQDVSSNAQAWLARGDWGADGYGDTGGHFYNFTGLDPDVFVASGNTGIYAYNTRYVGADHEGHVGSSGHNNVAWTPYTPPDLSGNYSVFGFEPKAFVQNDPVDASKSVVYVALEGDEAGTYTRGQARLRGGVAHVPLDPAFALVTNPDIGLTASLTPRRSNVPLTIASLTSQELVVRSAGPSDDVVFDFMVSGLRIGFETHPPIQDRVMEGPPHVRADFPTADEPQTQSALRRWSTVREAIGERSPLDLSRSDALVALARRPGNEPLDGAPGSAARHPASGGAVPLEAAPASAPAATFVVDVAGVVRAGDLLATDPVDAARPFVLAGALPGQTVIGIAASSNERTAALALAGRVVPCHADATAASIAAGDLLVASPLPGHAMRAPAVPAPGTIVARALEPLSGGTGTILVRIVTQ
jgi:hypothetical protein